MGDGKRLIEKMGGQHMVEVLIMATAVIVVLILFFVPPHSSMKTSANDVLTLPRDLIQAKNAEIRF